MKKYLSYKVLPHGMDLNEDAIAECLLLKYVLGDHTFRKGEKVKRLLDVPKFEVYEGATVSDVENALKKSIQKITEGKEKVGIFLSGGKDSRLLLALANSLKIDVTAVTISDRIGRIEDAVASKVAKTLKIPHKILRIPNTFSPDIISEIVDITDGLIPFSGLLPLYLLKEELSEKFDIILSGDLMSEIMDMCEYRWYESKDPIKVMKRKHFIGKNLLKKEYADMVEEKFISMYKDKSLEEIILDTEIRNRRIRVMETLSRIGGKVATPVLDSDLISSVFSLPFEQRINGCLVKAILKKSYPELMKIRCTRSIFPLFFPWWAHEGFRRIRDNISFIKNGFKLWAGEPRYNKLGMWDTGFHFKYTIGDYIKETIETLDLEMIDRESIKQLLQKHFSEQKDCSGNIEQLPIIKIWIDKNLH